MSVKTLDHALALVESGISLTPYTIYPDGRRQPWDKWASGVLSVRTADQVRHMAEKENCHGFQFFAVDAGWCVVDIDRKGGKDGLASLDKEAKARGIRVPNDLPRFLSRTPNNGMHLYYLADEWLAGVRSCGIVEGVDLLCSRRSLVVVPGSLGRTKDGEIVEYTAEGNLYNIAAMPAQLRHMLEAIETDKAKARAADQERKRREADERRRHRPNMEGGNLFAEANERVSAGLIEALFSAPGAYWAAGRRGQEYWTLNPTRQDNSIGSFAVQADGVWYDHNGNESGDIIDLISKAYNLTPFEAASMVVEQTGGNPKDYMRRPSRTVVIDLGQEVEAEVQKVQAEAQTTGETMVGKLKVMFGDDIPAEYEAPDEIVQGLLVSKTVTVLYGDSNSGKTFFALSLAGAVAEGLPFHGRETERGVVIYLAVEAPQSIKTRIQAMQRYYGKRFKDIAVVPVPLNFYSSEGDAAAVIALIKEIEATRGPVRLVVGDTLARISAGANENSGEDMGPVMARFSAISEQTDASVLIIHHNGKDQARGARGWSGIRAHVDTEIEVVEADKIHTATITKQRSLDSKGEALVFTLKVMEMGLGKFGNVSTTCVAVPSDEKPVTRERKKVAADKAIIEDAWRWSGSQYDCHNRKYIARKDLIEYMVDVMAKPESSAQQEVKPGKNRLIGRLVSEKIVESFPGGWSILPDDERLEV